MKQCVVAPKLLRFLPSTTAEWIPFLRRALQRPLAEVEFPNHFFVHAINGTARSLFSPHKPLLRPLRHDDASAVLLMFSPAGPSTQYTSTFPETSQSATSLFQDLSLTVTKRSMCIRHHRGELSFPGGHIEEGETAIQAALRETKEEIGLEVDESLVLGALTCITSARGTPVTPVVVLSPEALNPQCASPQEVDSIHYLHLSNLLLRSDDTHCRLLKCRSRFSNKPCYFPCYFASTVQEEPSRTVTNAIATQPTPRPHPTDGQFSALLPSHFPGEVVWGLTNFITNELLARLAAELLHSAGTSENAPSLLRCTNVVARDPDPSFNWQT